MPLEVKKLIDGPGVYCVSALVVGAALYGIDVVGEGDVIAADVEGAAAV